MKKLIAMLLAAMMVMSFCLVPAMAEEVAIDETSLVLDLGDLGLFELSEEDEEDGVLMIFGDEEETIVGVVMLLDAEGNTLADIEALESEDLGEGISTGYTTINDIETLFIAGEDEDGMFFNYYILEGEILVYIEFWCADENAAQLQNTVMSTLTRAAA